MTKTVTLLIFAILLSVGLQAQIKRQYQDSIHLAETVVIKDSATVSDMEILNNEFNIDEYEVGEVIRITTENLPESSPGTAAPKNDPVTKKDKPTRVISAFPPSNSKTKKRFNPRFKKKKRKKRKNKKFKKNKCPRF